MVGTTTSTMTRIGGNGALIERLTQAIASAANPTMQNMPNPNSMTDMSSMNMMQENAESAGM